MGFREFQYANRQIKTYDNHIKAKMKEENFDKTYPQIGEDTILLDEALHGELGEDQQRIALVGLQWITTLLKKNIDYGSTVWDTPILAPHLKDNEAILVRMSDKIARMNNLLTVKSNPKVEESLEDTIRDLGGYALLLLASPTHPSPGKTD